LAKGPLEERLEKIDLIWMKRRQKEKQEKQEKQEKEEQKKSKPRPNTESPRRRTKQSQLATQSPTKEPPRVHQFKPFYTERMYDALKLTSPLRGGGNPTLSRTTSFNVENLENLQMCSITTTATIKREAEVPLKRKRDSEQLEADTNSIKKSKNNNLKLTIQKKRNPWVLPPGITLDR